MKIFTASYFDPELHGPGRKVSICSSKPKNLQEEQGYDCVLQHEWLSPEQIYWDYINAKKAAGANEELAKKAGQDFVVNYLNRLDEFKTDLEKQSEESGKSIFELIGFEDGDTLLSWERAGNLTYRTHAAEFLRSLGYEVEER